MKRRYKWLLALAALVTATGYWFLVDNRPDGAAERPIPLAELRKLADSIPGPKPTGVAIQQVGTRSLPAMLFIAGGGLGPSTLSIQAAELSGPWGGIVVDSGLGAEDAKAMGIDSFDPAKQAQIDAALRRARLIVFTHEHADHMGGLLRLPDFAAVAPKALISAEQLSGNHWADKLPWPKSVQAAIKPFRYGALAAVAPGVALIRTPGHTKGSQMIYARLADGRELLFAGDTATMARSWQETRARSRLVGDLFVGEDRNSVFGWLKGVLAAHNADPKLVVIPGHEADALQGYVKAGAIRWGFPPARESGVASPESIR